MTYRLEEIEIPKDEPFKYDTLDRREIVDFLKNQLARINGPFVLALDSPWGTGKTTLLRMLQRELSRDNYECVYFNAWKADFAADPLVAIVESVGQSIHASSKTPEFEQHFEKVKKVTSRIAKRVAVAGVKIVTMGALDLQPGVESIISDEVGGATGNLVDLFTKEKEYLEQFRSLLTKAVESLELKEGQGKLFLFVDELDRCRPNFAVELLERVKHVFDLPNIIFLLSIDKQQLECAVKAVYGDGINAREYLRRFIDLEYLIPQLAPESFTSSLLTRFQLDEIFADRQHPEIKADRDHFVSYFTLLADVFDLSLRARERCITRLRVVLDQTPNNQHLDPILVALMIVLRSNEPSMFRRLLTGQLGSKDMMEYIYSTPSGSKLKEADTGSVIEAFLLAADSDSSRVAQRQKELHTIAADSAEIIPNRGRATRVLDLYKHLSNPLRPSRLKSVAAKIELTEMIKN